MGLGSGWQSRQTPAPKPRLRFGLTVLLPEILATARFFAMACITRCWDKLVYCSLPVATNANSPRTSSRRSVISRTVGKGQKEYETKSQHLARRSADSPTSRQPGLCGAILQSCVGRRQRTRVLLIALRRVVQARGIAKIAKTAGVERESLYRALSTRGNPRVHAGRRDQGSRAETQS
jgi:hypothetical protein